MSCFIEPTILGGFSTYINYSYKIKENFTASLKTVENSSGSVSMAAALATVDPVFWSDREVGIFLPNCSGSFGGEGITRV